MSYLNPLRLHFAGTFQAAPSTVNNDPAHFDNETFLARYQQYGPKATDGWWNPRGNADFRLIGCKVTAAWQAGKPVAGDSILQCLIADSNTRVAGKLVDLDSEQQMVSEIWGMEVRICTADGATLVKGRFQPAAFADIWLRFPTGGPDSYYGAMYQSVLVDLEWADVSRSPFLTALKAAASTGRLSIKFNVDGFDDDVTSPTFTVGRIVGTIGPAATDEPAHLVLGRHFLATSALNTCVAAVDDAAGVVYVDLGNALPTSSAGGPLQDLGTLSLSCIFPNDANNQPVPPLPLGTIAYLDANWYATTAGVVAVPVTGTNLQQTNALGLLLTKAGAQTDGVTEPLGGLYVRADQFVFRLEPGETAHAQLYATVFGKPLAGATVINIFDPTQLQGQAVSNTGTAPTVATPPDAISFPCRIVTDSRGTATLDIVAANPGNPRVYIDGQVYGVRPMLQDTIPPPLAYPFNGTEFISILSWSEFKIATTPTWQDLKATFQQYANLYPVMDRFLNLADYESVCERRSLLLLAFGLPVDDPNSMPVTRDLSPARRAAILKWLQHLGADGKPLFGKAPAAPLAKAAPRVAETGPPSAAVAATKGGKGAAMARRIARRRTT
jgi:hypothetical protein